MIFDYDSEKHYSRVFHYDAEKNIILVGEGLAAGATARARGEGAGRGATAQGARQWRKGANTRARSSRRCERAVERTRGSGGAGAPPGE